MVDDGEAEVEETEGTYGLTKLSCVCGWWSWSSASTTSMAASSPADGGSVEDGSHRGGL